MADGLITFDTRLTIFKNLLADSIFDAVKRARQTSTSSLSGSHGDIGWTELRTGGSLCRWGQSSEQHLQQARTRQYKEIAEKQADSEKWLQRPCKMRWPIISH